MLFSEAQVVPKDRSNEPKEVEEVKEAKEAEEQRN